jgi:hypothetical protein
VDESRRFYKQETTEWSQTSKLLEAENWIYGSKKKKKKKKKKALKALGAFWGIATWKPWQ